MGDYESLTTSSAGVAGGTTLIDTDLANLTEDNDGIQGWVFLTSGSASGEIRRIKITSGYTASTTTITVNQAFSAQVATSVTYELHRINPVDKHNALNRAIESVFPDLYLPIIDTSLVIDDLLSNSDMETFASSNFTNWTAVGSPTLSASTSRYIHGTQAASVISQGGTVGQLTQSLTVNTKEITSRTASLKFWVYATASDVARVRLDWDGGSTFTNSEYHDGSDEWQLLDAVGTVPDDATQIKAILEVAAGTNTVFFDRGYLSLTPVYRYSLPSTFRLGPYRVMEQYDIHRPEGPYLEIPPYGVPTSGRVLRMEGADILTRPTSDTATTEVDGSRVDLIVAAAAEYLHRILKNRLGSPDSEDLEDFWREEKRRLMIQPGIRMRLPSAEIPYGTWHAEEDSSSRYLVFDVPR